MPEIEQNVRNFLVDNFLFGEGAAEFSNHDSFIEKGLIDSISLLTLVVFVKETYGVEISDEELIPDNWDSIHRIVSFVQSKLSTKKPA